MHVIHGTWIPDDTHDEFIQRGAFYLWVEADTPSGKSRRRADAVHPRHLMDTALATFLMEKLGLREPVSGALARTLSSKYFLLPTAADKPSPCSNCCAMWMRRSLWNLTWRSGKSLATS